MIARIQGVLEAVEGGAALLRLEGGLTYQVLVSAFTAQRLGASIGQVVKLHTMHFIESQGQGTTMIPRLAGFLSLDDRRFYELFTTCKGVGNKRALRAMSMSTQQIAAAIADRDVALLQSLPEIGKRMADTIVATLSGKVDDFALGGGSGDAASSQSAQGVGGDMPVAGTLARDALNVLVQLGENRAQAVMWIDTVLRQKDRPGDVQALITRVYAMKAEA